MKLRYFVVDRQHQVRKASSAAVQGLWRGRHGAEALGCPAGHQLLLAGVVCDDNLIPEKVFLLRVPLLDGWFTLESQLTLQAFAMPDCVTPREAVRHHTEGWPANLAQQLAVALDVPLSSLRVPFEVGGPLFSAALMRPSPRQARRHLQLPMGKAKLRVGVVQLPGCSGWGRKAQPRVRRPARPTPAHEPLSEVGHPPRPEKFPGQAIAWGDDSR